VSEDSTQISVVVIDDHVAVLDAMTEWFSALPTVELVGAAHDAQEGLDLITRLQPQVAVVDVRMPKLSGMDVLRAARDRELATRILLHSAQFEETMVAKALRSGAAGCVLKGGPASTLVNAISAVAEGDIFIDPDLGG
jgi:two-component system, NarL family, nitrate/nitrite response regulator NarL